MGVVGNGLSTSRCGVAGLFYTGVNMGWINWDWLLTERMFLCCLWFLNKGEIMLSSMPNHIVFTYLLIGCVRESILLAPINLPT